MSDDPSRDDLISELRANTTQVDGLATAVTALAERARKNKRHIRLTVIAVVLDVILSITTVWLVITLNDTVERTNCQNALRADLSKIAEKDRTNTSGLILKIGSGTIKTPADFQKAFGRFKAVNDADNAARARLGATDSGTCG